MNVGRAAVVDLEQSNLRFYLICHDIFRPSAPRRAMTIAVSSSGIWLADERLDEVEELLDAAITVNEGKGQLLVL